MNTKKILAALLSLLMLLALAGCGEADDYETALGLMEQSEWEAARAMFVDLAGYEDSFAMMNECDYNIALELMEKGDYGSAANLFDDLANGLATGSYKESAALLDECRYQTAVSLYNDGKTGDALGLFSEIKGYKDADSYIELCKPSDDGADDKADGKADGKANTVSGFVADMAAAFRKAGTDYRLESGDANGDVKYYYLKGEGCSENTLVLFAPLDENGLVAAKGAINGIVVAADAGDRDELCAAAGAVLDVLCEDEAYAGLTAKLGDMLENLPTEGTLTENAGVELTEYRFELEGYNCKLTENDKSVTFTVSVPGFAE